MREPIWYLRDHSLNFTLIMPRSKVIELLLTFDDPDLRVVRAGKFPPSDTEPKKKVASRDVNTTLRAEAPSDTQNYSLVERIRQGLPIAPFVAPHTGGLKASGNGWFIGRCPFHDSRDRKFWVNPAKGICGCFVPRCPAHNPPLDIINFYALLKGITNNQAIKELESRL